MSQRDPGRVKARLAEMLEGRYRIEEEAGRGSMARVYRAVELASGRPVAIKLLPPEAASGANAERFQREIALTRSLDHPNILPLIDSGSAEGFYWYVMPFLAGETVREAMAARGLMAIPEAVRITVEVGRALSHAHSMGVIHRDLKPENIMVREGRALVLDFGLARALDVQSNLTGSGMPLGTPAYMSPEQILGAADAGASADLYSLACVTYEMLTGRPPFVGAGVVNVLQGHLRLTPAPPSHHRREIHRGIDAAILRALAKTPEARQGSVDQFVAELAEPPADGSARPPAPPVETRPAPGLLGRLFGKR